MQAEVVRHEPQEALDGGGKLGLQCLKDICRAAPTYLMPGGFIGLETGGIASIRQIIVVKGPLSVPERLASRCCQADAVIIIFC